MGNKFLIIGGSGELGSQIVRQRKGMDTYFTYYSNQKLHYSPHAFELDIRDFQSVDSLFSELKPRFIIDASVSDRSIKNMSEKNAMCAIIDGAVNVARAGARAGSRTVHVSTDLVFDGMRGNYDERSQVNPLSFYGKCKAEMEERLLGLNFDLAIVRTSLIITFVPMGHQVSWIVNTLRVNSELRLFTDEYRSPVLGEDLAGAILELSQTDFRGLINIAGPESINRYELGSIIAGYTGMDKNLIRPVLSKEINMQRQLNCTLNSSLAYSFLKTRCRRISELI